MPDSKKDAAKAGAKQGTDKATKAVGATFDKLKSHFEPKKVDKWQEKWLNTPESRKKYKKVADAPEVVGEELTAMVNDIIDFAQGEEGGKSHLFSKVKGSLGGLLGKAKGAVSQAKEQAGKATSQAKGAANKAKGTATKAKKSAKK